MSCVQNPDRERRAAFLGVKDGSSSTQHMKHEAIVLNHHPPRHTI